MQRVSYCARQLPIRSGYRIGGPRVRYSRVSYLSVPAIVQGRGARASATSRLTYFSPEDTGCRIEESPARQLLRASASHQIRI